ncbi:hypothetical protein [Hansschlegelia zhihuaiae]|uniref:Uncharacterized protein n=1 Tax=Hansschlegelia zhihuaiae TaxID=405005 RepID=A0A4Q0MDS3_9HYPH|nr:hypothetical protein [Hansschlegelia zhihuaiae]RXF70956.1 hypothetical protein EK403_16250 [Hansschlegelia zhihuaiae]
MATLSPSRRGVNLRPADLDMTDEFAPTIEEIVDDRLNGVTSPRDDRPSVNRTFSDFALVSDGREAEIRALYETGQQIFAKNERLRRVAHVLLSDIAQTRSEMMNVIRDTRMAIAQSRRF